MKTEKELLHQHCQDLLSSRIAELETMLQSIQESKHNETKSSAGDKFETGRAMMQMEEDKVKAQLELSQYAKAQLLRLGTAPSRPQVNVGSLIKTEKRNYYFSISLGKVVVDEIIYYCISPNAPISKALIGLSIGDQLSFNGRQEKVLEIL